MKVEGFDWDAGNTFKSEEKHGLSREIIEQFFRQKIWVAHDPKHSQLEDRFLAIGTLQNGRHVIVAFTFRLREGKKLIRPISERNMNRREINRYEKNLAPNER